MIKQRRLPDWALCLRPIPLQQQHILEAPPPPHPTSNQDFGEGQYLSTRRRRFSYIRARFWDSLTTSTFKQNPWSVAWHCQLPRQKYIADNEKRVIHLFENGAQGTSPFHKRANSGFSHISVGHDPVFLICGVENQGSPQTFRSRQAACGTAAPEDLPPPNIEPLS